MSDQSYLAAVPFLVAALVYAACTPRLRSRPDGQRRALDRMAGRVRLPVPSELRQRLERALRGTHLGADLGGAAAVALLAAWGLTLGRTVAGGRWWLLLLWAGALAGAAVGAGVAALADAARPRNNAGLRIARPIAPSFDDYIAPVELQGGRAVAVLPALLLVVLVVLDAGDATGELLGPAIAAGLALAALVFAEFGARRVLAAPQAAGSELELAWSDALRAHTLRAVVTVPITVGLYASVGVASAFDLSDVAPNSVLGVSLVLLVVGVVVALLAGVVWSLTGEPHRYFRRRLWPNGGPSGRLAPSGGPS